MPDEVRFRDDIQTFEKMPTEAVFALIRHGQVENAH